MYTLYSLSVDNKKSSVFEVLWKCLKGRVWHDQPFDGIPFAKCIREPMLQVQRPGRRGRSFTMINIVAAWIGFALGGVAGMIPGLFFHRQDWLGGYTSWPRRLIRLAHISFFGIGFLNLGMGLTGRVLDINSQPASILMLVGAVTMPLVCYASALRPVFRNLFFIPAGSVLLSVILFIERLV